MFTPPPQPCTFTAVAMEQGAEVCACLTPLVDNRKTLGFTTPNPFQLPLAVVRAGPPESAGDPGV